MSKKVLVVWSEEDGNYFIDLVCSEENYSFLLSCHNHYINFTDYPMGMYEFFYNEEHYLRFPKDTRPQLNVKYDAVILCGMY
jgi:hypothetical protein